MNGRQEQVRPERVGRELERDRGEVGQDVRAREQQVLGPYFQVDKMLAQEDHGLLGGTGGSRTTEWSSASLVSRKENSFRDES